MQIACDSCGATIPAADMNLQTLVARCRRCDSVFSFGGRITGGAAPAPRRRTPLPRGLKVEAGEPPLPSEPTNRTAARSDRGPLVITRRWFSPLHVFMLFFCLFWDGFLVLWYSIAVEGGAPVEMILFPLIHVGVGVGLTYSTLAGFLNRTVIRVADGMLSIRHGPLPWMGNRTIPTSDLRQLYIRRRVYRGKNGTSTKWELRADTTDDVTVKLLAGMASRDQAEYIEWAIEEHLGIEDDPRYSDGG